MKDIENHVTVFHRYEYTNSARDELSALHKGDLHLVGMDLHPRCCHHWKCMRICREDFHRFSAGKAAKTKESSDELRCAASRAGGSKANGASALRAVQHKLKVKLTDGLEKLRMQAGIMHRGLKEEDASAAAVMRL